MKSRFSPATAPTTRASTSPCRMARSVTSESASRARTSSSSRSRPAGLDGSRGERSSQGPRLPHVIGHQPGGFSATAAWVWMSRSRAPGVLERSPTSMRLMARKERPDALVTRSVRTYWPVSHSDRFSSNPRMRSSCACHGECFALSCSPTSTLSSSEKSPMTLRIGAGSRRTSVDTARISSP